jgi:membrane associated rhomboid family serine protease
MILPIGDKPNPSITPVMTYALIIVNIVVFAALFPLQATAADPNDPLLQQYLQVIAGNHRDAWPAIAARLTDYDLLLFRHGYRVAAPSASGLVASMFLHGGLLHLLGNMLVLWIFGNNVEDRLGRVGFLLVYLGTGVAATLFFSLFAMHSRFPLVGASGAISGVLGCYFVWFPKNQVVLLIWLLIFMTVEIPARWMLGAILIIDNLLPFLQGGDGSGVAHGAHIGGFLAGVLVAVIAKNLTEARTISRRRRR